MNIINRVKNTILKNNLIKKDDKILVALSGGSDSVFMTHILKILSKEMGFSLYAAHLNHNIRAEAKKDEGFVLDFCKNLGIECFVKSVDIRVYAKENKISEELAGRKARYDFFEELKEKYKINKVATAHNKDDSAESIMLHFLRGCGIDGMSGIPAMRDGFIIRPILDITKKEIEEYCNENSIKYVVDKTNFETDYTRNKIRLKLIPLIEKDINKNFINTITNNSIIFKNASDFIYSSSERAYKRCVYDNKIDINKLLEEHECIISNVIIMHYNNFIKSKENLSGMYVNKIIELIKSKNMPKSMNLPKKVIARAEYGYLFFENLLDNGFDFEYKIEINKKTTISESDISVLIKEEKEKLKDSKDKIYFYSDSNEFYVRNRRKADKFLPVGMNGTKNISDYFTDLKIPLKKRKLIPFLVCEDKIIWIIGYRKDRRSEKGKTLYSITIIKENE